MGDVLSPEERGTMGDAQCIKNVSGRELEAQGVMSDILSLRNEAP